MKDNSQRDTTLFPELEKPKEDDEPPRRVMTGGFAGKKKDPNEVKFKFVTPNEALFKDNFWTQSIVNLFMEDVNFEDYDPELIND